MYLACLWWLIILTAVKIISKWTFSRFHTQFLINFIYQGTAAFSIWEVCLTDQASAASRALPVLSELQLKDVRAECRFLSDFVVAALVQSWCCQLLLSAILHPLFPSTPLQAAGAELLMLISPLTLILNSQHAQGTNTLFRGCQLGGKAAPDVLGPWLRREWN